MKVNQQRLVLPRQANFQAFYLFLGHVALNYLLCCVHLDAKFPVMLIQGGALPG